MRLRQVIDMIGSCSSIGRALVCDRGRTAGSRSSRKARAMVPSPNAE
jgi:hypothetical protein